MSSGSLSLESSESTKSGGASADAARTPDDIESLEYSTLRVPYEFFNKRFRLCQKTMERHNLRVKECTRTISKMMKNEERKNPISKREVAILARFFLGIRVFHME
ncbi:unnamed protein product [Gongylonema pulchrum]|uniref:BHLH domain-containing protein n=1 Tax=Gongylonema pulchrum TaxID=637853 RepID=A0A183EBY8_9BILA|nr:unnamed protein product [Gongylonema pulchrum]